MSDLLEGYHELDYLELRLKRSKDDEALRKVLVELNNFERERLGSSSPAVKARYSMLRGVTYAKGASLNTTSWLGNSSVESMFYALDRFAYADEQLGSLARAEPTGQLTGVLQELRRSTAYEASVVMTRLCVWGVPLTELKVTPSTGSLSAREQSKIKKALDRVFMLTSRF